MTEDDDDEPCICADKAKPGQQVLEGAARKLCNGVRQCPVQPLTML